MEIALERYLDDTARYHVTLALRSRTTEAHSVLTALDSDERAAVSAALARALDEVQRVLTARLAAGAVR
jgi:hypothetical protein